MLPSNPAITKSKKTSEIVKGGENRENRENKSSNVLVSSKTVIVHSPKLQRVCPSVGQTSQSKRKEVERVLFDRGVSSMHGMKKEDIYREYQHDKRVYEKDNKKIKALLPLLLKYHDCKNELSKNKLSEEEFWQQNINSFKKVDANMEMENFVEIYMEFEEIKKEDLNEYLVMPSFIDYCYEKKMLQYIQKLIQENKTDEVDEIVGMCGSPQEIMEKIIGGKCGLSIGDINKEINRLGENIDSEGGNISSTLVINYLNKIKKLTIHLSRIIDDKDGELSKAENSCIRNWFKHINLIVQKCCSMPANSEMDATVFKLVKVLSLSINKKVLTNDLIPTLMMPNLIAKIATFLIYDDIGKNTKLLLSNLIQRLCRQTKSDAVFNRQQFSLQHDELNSALFLALKYSGQHITKKSIDVIMKLVVNKTELFLFDFIKIIVQHYGLIDFDHSQIEAIISQHCDNDTATFIRAYLQQNYDSIINFETDDANLLWLKGMVCYDALGDDVQAEAYLKQAAEKQPRLGLEFAIFYLTQEHLLNQDLLLIIKNALDKAKDYIPNWDKKQWVECYSSTMLMLEQTKAAKAEELATTSSSDSVYLKQEAKLATQLLCDARNSDIATATATATVTDSDSDSDSDDEMNYFEFNLTQATAITQGILKLYQIHESTPRAVDASDSGRPFKVIDSKGKLISIVEAMKFKSRNVIIFKLLRALNYCRIENDVSREFSLYKNTLANPRLRYMIGFERVIEELAWSLIRSINDPHRGGFNMTLNEKLEALDVVKDLMMTCLQYTMRQEYSFPPDMSDENLISHITSWLNNLENFDNNTEAQEFMRFSLRCRAGSTMGHIHSLMAEFGRKSSEDKALLFFNAKRKLQPSYDGKNHKHETLEEQKNERVRRQAEVGLFKF